MAKEVFQITEDTEEWHVQGILSDGDYRTARLMNIMYDIVHRKVPDDRHPNVAVLNPGQEFAVTPEIV
jgi:hypothetical protein